MRRFLGCNGPVHLLFALCAMLAGCGTTKWSDSPRTATEQLLISDAVDQAISKIDFSALADKDVFLDTRFIITALDQNYVVSTLRQHMLASGVIIKDKPEDSTYVVEVRTGSLGTNRQDLLFGVPSTTLPTVGMLPTGSATIPEIALLKRTNQQGVCKIAVFAYDRMSGRPVWQSGNRKIASKAKDVWVLGAGPFQRGTIYDGTAFAGERLEVPLVNDKNGVPPDGNTVAREKVFLPNNAQYSNQLRSTGVSSAGYLAPLPNSTQPAAVPATAPAAAVPAAAGAPPAPIPQAPQKAAYTPPPAAIPAALPPVPPAGPQGNLTPQTILSATANPATTTAGAIQTYNIAKDLFGKQPAP